MLAVDERAARVEARRADNRRKREERRVRNRAAWENSPMNVNYVQAMAVVVAAPIPADESAEPGETRALAKLRRIMADTARPIAQRVEAASSVLAYELSPAALANVPNEQEIATASYRFLVAAADAPDTPEGLRIKILRDIAAVENARASRVDPDEAAERRERAAELINAHRRMELARSGMWPVPPGSPRWTLNTADDFDLPPQMQERQGSSMTHAQLLEAARAQDPTVRQHLADERHRLMLMVEAKNRDDRTWRKLLGETG